MMYPKFYICRILSYINAEPVDCLYEMCIRNVHTNNDFKNIHGCCVI